jgi:hypothetical protein
MRHQAEEGDAVDAVSPPLKVPRIVYGRASCPINSTSQSPEPSDQDKLSSGDSRGPSDSGASSHFSEPAIPPTDNHHLLFPSEVPIGPRQSRQALNAASDEEPTDGWGTVVERTNPRRGPTTGGPEIWISGSNFPIGLQVYVRFGDNFARAVSVLLPSLGKRLTTPRSFKNLTCSRAFCLLPMSRAKSESHSPAAPLPGPLLWVQVCVNLNTLQTFTSCESRRHPFRPLLR